MSQPFAQAIPLQGGIDIRLDPRVIRDDQMAQLANVYPDQNGILVKRPALRYAFGTLSCRFSKVMAIARAAPNSGAAYIVVGWDAVSGGTVLTAIDAAGLQVAAYPASGAGLVTNDNPTIVTYENQTIVFPGAGYDGCVVWHNGMWTTCSYTIDVPSAPGQPQTSGVLSPEVAFLYRGRVVIANFGAGNLTRYSMSDYNYPAGFAPPSQFFVPRFLLVGAEMLAFNAPHGTTLRDEVEPIIAGIEFMLQMVGSATQAGFLLLGNRYAYIGTGVFGASIEVTAALIAGDFELKRINYDCGCAGKMTLLRTQYGVLWVGPDDVWLMDTGGAPRRVGTNIRSAIQACPPSLLGSMWAVFADNTYKLAIPTQMSGEEGPEYLHYWLDMRTGPPKSAEEARWYGPHQYKHIDIDGEALPGRLGPGVVDAIDNVLVPCGISNSSAVGMYAVFANLSGKDEIPWDYAFQIANDPLVFDPLADYVYGDIVRPTDQYSTANSENGRHYMVTTGGNPSGVEPAWPNSGTVTAGTVTFTEMLSLAGLDYRCPQSNLGTGSSPLVAGRSFQTQVLFDLLSKDYDHGAKSTNKTLARVETTFESELPGALNMDFIQNNGSSTDTAEALTGVDANAQLGSFVLSQSVVSNQEHHRSFRPAEDRRALFQCAQYRFYDDSSFVIDDSNDTMWLIGKDGEFITTIPQGRYATMTLLCTAIITAITAILVARGNTIAQGYHTRTGLTGQLVVIGIVYEAATNGNPDASCSLVFNRDTDTPANRALQKRCANLFALLGYDTSRAAGADTQGTAVFYNDATAGALVLWASKSVPERNPQLWRMIDATAFGKVWGGGPFTKSDRKSGNAT